jgi:ABC-type bacteriocin/lantibiotic exporter with double-glycine peptidase domain
MSRQATRVDPRYKADTILDLYRAIWRVTGRQQFLLIALSVMVAVLAAVPLRFQKLVVNGLVEGSDMRRVSWLCAGILGTVLLSAALKFALNYRLSVLGESIVLLIRERLYAEHVGRPTADTAGAPKRGTLVTMLAAEAESVGEFAGSAIAQPLMLISVIAFILASQPWLGVLVLGIIGPQAAIVISLQGRLNQRVRERVQLLRDASDRISEGDLSRVDPEVGADFRAVFETERRIFFLKLSAKFVLNVITGAGAVGILFLGGWLVLSGRSDVGTVMASLTGLARMDGPWRELVGFFRNASTVRVKYAMLVRAITEQKSMESVAP